MILYNVKSISYNNTKEETINLNVYGSKTITVIGLKQEKT